LRESSGFVCITGDVGTGKTTLLRAFLAGLGPETASAYIFNPPVSAFALLKTINGELGLFTATRSRKKLVDALNVHLLAQREAGRRSLVVIDEAQALSIDVLEQLRLLSNLETTTEKLLRIVLVGQPQLRSPPPRRRRGGRRGPRPQSARGSAWSRSAWSRSRGGRSCASAVPPRAPRRAPSRRRPRRRRRPRWRRRRRLHPRRSPARPHRP